MAVVSDAFYLPTDDPDVFVATARTEGPWEPQTQHAGPPSALLTRTIERLPSSIPGPSQLTRLTMEILGPVRTGEVRVRARVGRPGRAVELVEAELESEGRPAMRAAAWRIRTTHVELPPLSAVPTAPPIPETETPFEDPAWRAGYLGAIDFRSVHGHFERPGPAAGWIRLKYPLLPDEQPSPTQRLMAVADSGNGLSSQLDFSRWWFINTELTVHLIRPPVGEWLYMDARSTLDHSGVGLAETEMYDTLGRVGRGAQALLVGPR
jgi:acyl-coenzyme A thioesterase PaaI-like protein